MRYLQLPLAFVDELGRHGPDVLFPGEAKVREVWKQPAQVSVQRCKLIVPPLHDPSAQACGDADHVDGVRLVAAIVPSVTPNDGDGHGLSTAGQGKSS